MFRKILIILILISFCFSFSQAGCFSDKKSNFDVLEFRNKLISHDLPINNIINPYINNTNVYIRLKAYYQIWHVARFENIPKKKKDELIDTLTMGLKSSLIQEKIIYLLNKLKSDDFTDNSKKILSEYYKDIELNYTLIHLYGIADLHIRDIEIQKLAQDNLSKERQRFLQSKQWASLLVLARREDTNAISRVVKITLDTLGVESITTNVPPTVIRYNKPQKRFVHMDIARNILCDIAYIKQPESIDILWAFLNSDDVISTRPRILFADFALRGLIILIDNFPVKMFPGPSYPEGEIIKGRKWMETNGQRIRKSFKLKQKV